MDEDSTHHRKEWREGAALKHRMKEISMGDRSWVIGVFSLLTTYP